MEGAADLAQGAVLLVSKPALEAGLAEDVQAGIEHRLLERIQDVGETCGTVGIRPGIKLSISTNLPALYRDLGREFNLPAPAEFLGVGSSRQA